MSLIVLDVLEEHLDEAAFRWVQWERALVAPNFDLAESAQREERWAAHVDGLVEAGDAVVEALLLPALESGESSRVSAAATALLAGGPERLEAVLARWHDLPEQRSALQRALELVERDGLDVHLRSLLGEREPGILAAAVELLVARGTLSGERLEPFLLHGDARVLRAALRGVLPVARDIRRDSVARHLVSSDPGIREAAIEAGLACGLREAWTACRRAVEARHREALVPWALGSDEQEASLLLPLLGDAELRPHALWALGFTGQLAAADACLEWMADPAVASLAGEAFSAITGLVIQGPYAMAGPSEPFDEPVALEQENLDADLTLDPVDDLPKPDAQAVAGWWRAARGRFQRGRRYLRGELLDWATLLKSFGHEPMRRRHVLSRELALRSHGACFIRTRALARQQRVMAERAAAMPVHLPMRPLVNVLG